MIEYCSITMYLYTYVLVLAGSIVTTSVRTLSTDASQGLSPGLYAELGVLVVDHHQV